MEWLDALLGSGVRMTTPILLAALACLPTVWTRDINIGLEGIMIFGAFFGVAIGLVTGSVWVSLLGTLLLACLAGLCFALLVARLGVDVFVAGIVLYIFAGAATVYMLSAFFDVKGSLDDPATPGLPLIVIPGISDVPVLNGLLSGHSVLTWIAVLVVVVMIVLDRRSVIVVRLRAAGSHPAALAVSGVNVTRVRVLAQLWCFCLAALAGMQISLSQLTLYTVGMTGGMGFVALAVVIFAKGGVGRTAAIAVAFGFATALTFQADSNVLSNDLAKMLPYAAAFAALVVLSRGRGVARQAAIRAT
ncbi:MAG: ABC transporter permease [Leucobacter sp.]